MHWRCRLFGHLFRDITGEVAPDEVELPIERGRPIPIGRHVETLAECVHCGTRVRVNSYGAYIENVHGEHVRKARITIRGHNDRRTRVQQQRTAHEEQRLLLEERRRAARKQKRKDSTDA